MELRRLRRAFRGFRLGSHLAGPPSSDSSSAAGSDLVQPPYVVCVIGIVLAEEGKFRVVLLLLADAVCGDVSFRAASRERGGLRTFKYRSVSGHVAGGLLEDSCVVD